MAIVTVSRKILVATPKDIRDQLGIRLGQKFEAFAVGGRVELGPAHTMRGFRGSFPDLPPLVREPDRP